MICKKKPDARLPAKPDDKPAKPPRNDDDLYETGDIAGPVRDRDDEQRDL